ncbi:hypothetical protein B0H17DRAFT_1190267 [Mycena rosella]|uniref:Uncharacterized protein n=1 Tax=Mycena rosella TaxID=1033263 RepID=A0AAD7MCH0_MYCRO|nr:hypothetical protein B0H17DRAFT_1190267 [Mycena rosella]
MSIGKMPILSFGGFLAVTPELLRSRRREIDGRWVVSAQLDLSLYPPHPMERNYVEQDLVNLNRTQLVALVERQITKWPLPRGRLSKENMPSLRAILLNPTNGFTTTIFNTNTTMGSTAGNIRSDLQTAGISSTNPAPVPNIPDDRLNPTYTEYFVEFNSNEPVESLVTNPTLLVIPQNNRLNLRVDRIAPLRNVSAAADLAAEAAFQSLIPSAATSIPTASGSAIRIKEPTAKEMNWLKDKIAARPGYAKLNANRNKILQNVDRVEHWRFVCEVTKAIYKKPWPNEISSFRTIPKGAIQKVLQIGTTAFAEATQMKEIIECYTAEGDNFSQEVADEITKSEEEDPKATGLKAFLQRWEKEHPVQLE